MLDSLSVAAWVDGTRAKLREEAFQRAYQILHSAAANRGCEIVSSTKGRFTLNSFNDKCRGRQADLLYGCSFRG